MSDYGQDMIINLSESPHVNLPESPLISPCSTEFDLHVDDWPFRIQVNYY